MTINIPKISYNTPFEKDRSNNKAKEGAEQIFLVFKGQIRVTTGKESPRVIGPGDIWVVPSNCVHSVDYVEDTEALEVVSPIRLDNFVGYTISHTFFETKDS